ncbi:SprT family zinc-dependent metalloprotease [Hymenobacter seoulensis]
MSVTESSITYGSHELAFTVEVRPRRTLSITVHPDQRVHVLSPPDVSLAQIQARVTRRAAWILRQQAYFQQFRPSTPARRYVSGETHLYLGRQYRLRLEESEHSKVKLIRGRLVVHTPHPDDADLTAKLLRQWYQQHATDQFPAVLHQCLPLLSEYSLPTPTLHLRYLQKRWGSCSSAGRITLNTDLIRADKSAIAYVILHELCHLIEPNHSRRFFNLLTRVLPDWQRRKEKLEKALS